MGLNSISVRNFQSLKSVDLELGAFTVIVGPSSSGKSALIRAFRALIGNVRGNGMITRGQKQMAITVHTDTHVVTLERNDRQGLYRLRGPEGDVTFTKLAGEVPPQVTAVLRLDETINVASQFDKPFLLDESGATVARQLGELTNVNLIFEAVRQANRIRSNAASTLKIRRADFEAVRARVGQYRDLPDKLRLMVKAEALDAARKDLARRAGALSTAIRTVQLAERAVERNARPPLPDTTDYHNTLRQVLKLQEHWLRVGGAAATVQSCSKALQGAQAAAEAAEHDFQHALQAAGICPTCGQRTS